MLKIDKVQRGVIAAVIQKVRDEVDLDRILQERIRLLIEADRSSSRRGELTRRIEKLEREIPRLVRAIRATDGVEVLAQELTAVRQELSEVQYELAGLVDPRDLAKLEMPSQQALIDSLERVGEAIMNEDEEAYRLFSRVIPSLQIRPVQRIDGHVVELQAVAQFDLSAAVEALTGQKVEGLCEHEQIVVDLWDPPMHVAQAATIESLVEAGVTIWAIADQLAMSLPSVVNVRRLTRLMRERGLTVAYVPISEPPATKWRCRKHLSARYQFQTLEARQNHDGESEVV
jgi:hypothetical protein